MQHVMPHYRAFFKTQHKDVFFFKYWIFSILKFCVVLKICVVKRKLVLYIFFLVLENFETFLF